MSCICITRPEKIFYKYGTYGGIWKLSTSNGYTLNSNVFIWRSCKVLIHQNIEFKIVTKHICFLFEVPPEGFQWTLSFMMRLFILSKYFLFKTSTVVQHNTIIWASVISPTILLLAILISPIDVIKHFTFTFKKCLISPP